MSKSTRHTIYRDHIHHGWNNAFPPALKIAPGEGLNFGPSTPRRGRCAPHGGRPGKAKSRPGQPGDGAGIIDGAKPGDALKVSVLSFRPSGWGWTGNIPGFGLLSDHFPEARLHHWNYDPGLAPAMYGPGGRVPLRPFTGTIGVAPAAPGLHSIIPPRNVGGNMDARDIAEGAELYLPVEVEGAIFSVGDTHAAQGDGEVCGTAIESPIDVTLEIRSGEGGQSPLAALCDSRSRHQALRHQGLRGDYRDWAGPHGGGPHGGVRDDRASEPTFRLCARRRVHAVQRLRGICGSARSWICRTGSSRSTSRAWFWNDDRLRMAIGVTPCTASSHARRQKQWKHRGFRLQRTCRQLCGNAKHSGTADVQRQCLACGCARPKACWNRCCN